MSGRAYDGAGGLQELRLAALRDDPAVADHHDLVSYDLDLVQQVRREQHGATLVGVAAEQVAHPADAGRVEPVGGLVEDQHLRLPDQRGRNAEPLAHAERVVADPTVRLGVGEADQLEHLGNATSRQAHHPLGDREDLATGPAGVLRRCVQHHADLDARVGQVGEPTAGDGGGARGGRGEPTIIRIEVDLPAPFGPRKPVTRPAGATKLMSSTAVVLRYFFVRESTVIIGDAPWLRGCLNARNAAVRARRREVAFRGRRTDDAGSSSSRTWRTGRVEESGLVGQHDRLRTVAQPELLQQASDVRLDGRVADEELGADLGVGESARDQAEHLHLPGGQAAHRRGWRLPVQSGEVLDHAPGDAGGEQRLSPGDDPYRGDQLLGRIVP
jgi:hypothetical protein